MEEELEIIVKKAFEEPSDENILLLADSIFNTLNKKNIALYSKEGNLPDWILRKVFQKVEERSIEGRYHLDKKEVKVVVLEFEEEWLKSLKRYDISGEREQNLLELSSKVYLPFFEKLNDFIKKVPYYSRVPHLAELSTIISEGIYELHERGISERLYWMHNFEAHGSSSKNPVMCYEKSYTFFFNLAGLLMFAFGNPVNRPSKDEFIKSWFSYIKTDYVETFPDDFPILVPLIHFTWPEPLKGEEKEKAVNALKDYSKKVVIEPTENSYEVVVKGELSEYEKETAEKAGALIRAVAQLLNTFGTLGTYTIIATPLYMYDALDPNKIIESWNNAPYINYKMLQRLNQFSPAAKI